MGQEGGGQGPSLERPNSAVAPLPPDQTPVCGPSQRFRAGEVWDE